MHGKIEVFNLRCSRIFCQWESGYGSSFVYAQKKAFFPFFATQFSIFRANVMHITSASRIYPIEI